MDRPLVKKRTNYVDSAAMIYINDNNRTAGKYSSYRGRVGSLYCSLTNNYPSNELYKYRSR